MAFDDLPSRPGPIFEAAKAYADKVLSRSRAVVESGTVRYIGDIAFGPDYYQRVDIYAPLNVAEPLPVFLFLHGGAFIGGYKEWMGFMAPAITAIPALFISVSYRLAPEHPFPAPVEDTAAAVAWAWRNAAQFGGNPDRIFIGGHSAGGNLASLVTLDPRWLRPHGLPDDVIKGAAIVSAPFDLDYETTDPENEAALGMRRNFVPRDKDVPLASPLKLVSPGAPPFLIAAGENDLWSLAAEARTFASTLQSAGAPAQCEIYPGHDHFDTNVRCIEPDHPWIRNVASLLRSTGRS